MTPSPAPSPAHQVLFSRDGPRWFTIAAHRPFLDDLAFGVTSALAPIGPEALADALVLTPTRRAARELAEAFLRTGAAQALLLPQIRAIGDLDEGEPPFEPGDLSLDLPPAISPLRRRFELARLIFDHQGLLRRRLDASAALELADALASFLESLQIEEIADPDVHNLVDEAFAEHWQVSARFLTLALELWPKRLRELGLIDVTARRTQLLRALADQWRDAPPDRPLIAAGSTGTAPATADLLAVIAKAPQGMVVLPGLDRQLADSAWTQVGEAHPQGAMKRLLKRSGVAREAVRDWPTPESLADAARGRARARVMNEALRPAEATDDWRHVIETMDKDGEATGIHPIAQGLEGLSLIEARTEDEAAAAAALLMRETLETPGRTAALVTPDAALARRVSAKLARWDVRVDSSAGAPLADFPAGVAIGLMAQAAADPLSPPILLALLKHTRLSFGLDAARREAAVQTLERKGLRGARPLSWAALLARLEQYPEALHLAQALKATQDRLINAFAAGEAGLDAAVSALTLALEQAALNSGGRNDALWSGQDGEAAAAFLADLIEHGAALPPCTGRGFAQLIATLMAAQTVRAAGATHPRLKILGAIEARLIRADRLILAGLEEGVWPRPAEVDPFLSRPMRERLGLPPPERRIGLSAHDFAQAACSRDVALIHSERRGAQPSVKSRWLWRLETLAKGAGHTLPGRQDALDLARALDAALIAPPPALRAAPRPAPRPPLDVRPIELPVTDVERLQRDPYAIYAKRILGLRPLDRPDERVEARARGTAIHAAVERFAEMWEGLSPDEAPTAFAELYVQNLIQLGVAEGDLARERILALRAGAWVADLEARRRLACRAVRVEQSGRMGFDLADGSNFTLTAKADRLEVAEGCVHVLDFKTGAAPTRTQIETFLAPQLTLTGAILMAGGFEGLGPIAPGELVYLRLTGRNPPGQEEIRAGLGESEVLSAAALSGLKRLLARYRKIEQPYRSRTSLKLKAQVSDYDHLARVREWSAADEEGEA